MTISDSVIKDVEDQLKKLLQNGFYSHPLDPEDEEGEQIEVDFEIRNVRADGDKTILFDCISTVSCAPFAQEEAEMLISEQWVPDAIAKVSAAVGGGYDIHSDDDEISWEDE